MKFMIIFWAVYILFFCIPFPIFIYMVTSEETAEPRNSLAVSYGYLGFSFVVWGYILVYFVHNLFIKTFKERSTIQSILQNGVPREAKVINYKLLKYDPKSNINIIEIMLSFANLKNVQIEHNIMFHDTKPLEKRYDTGKTAKVLLNPTPSKSPYFMLAGQQTQFNSSGIMLRGIFILLMVAYVMGLYYYFYTKESFDFGWRFLTFMHPIIFSGVMILIFVLIFQFIFGKFFKNEKEERLMFAGRNAEANIISVSQTGLMVNDQPQIMFQVSFKDFRGTEHITVYKKVVGLLNLSSVPKQGKVEIMYDESDPKKIIIPKGI